MKVLMASVEGTFCPEIEDLLASVEGITVMKERIGPDAVYLIHELEPDLVLLDLDTVPSNHSAFVAKIGELHPDSKLVVLSAKEAAAPVLDALLNGAQGHIVKGASSRGPGTIILLYKAQILERYSWYRRFLAKFFFAAGILEISFGQSSCRPPGSQGVIKKETNHIRFSKELGDCG